MKYKMFLGLIVLVFTIGSIALADYVEPAGTPPSAPNNNTGVPLTVGYKTDNITAKLGVWEGANPTQTNSNFVKSVLKDGSYAGNETSTKGGFSEKLVVSGATRFLSSDLLTQIDNRNSTTKNLFDQYINAVNNNKIEFIYPENSNAKTAKPLEGIIAGRMLGGMAVTSNIDTSTQGGSNPNNYSLDLQATSTFSPTTNIGLGDSCDLYPADIGTSIDDGGGCPAGSYISSYQPNNLNFTAPLTSNNNNNTKTIATCTQFNPSIAPKNTGRCNNNLSNQAPASLSTSSIYLYCGFGKEYSNVLEDCPTLVQHRLKGSNSSWTYGKPSDMNSLCTSQSKYEVSVTNNCYYNGGAGVNYANTSLPNHSVGSPSCVSLLSLNNKRLKLPAPLSGNIKWYDINGNWLNSSSYNDKIQINDCSITKVIVTDLYGQFIEITKN